MSSFRDPVQAATRSDFRLPRLRSPSTTHATPRHVSRFGQHGAPSSALGHATWHRVPGARMNGRLYYFRELAHTGSSPRFRFIMCPPNTYKHHSPLLMMMDLGTVCFLG